MFFNKQFILIDSLVGALGAFISFSLIASSVYCLNDIVDVDYDRNHVTKKKRPIASASLNVLEAKICASGCLILGLISAWLSSSFSLVLVLVLYLVVNILYIYCLKHVIILDVVVIAIGFLLRLLAGSVATNTVLSYWILVLVLLLSLFLGFGKRRAELNIFINDNLRVRENIDKYSFNFLNGALNLLSVSIFVLYVLYTMAPKIRLQYDNQYIWITSIFVFAGLIRYKKIVSKNKNDVNPTDVLLKDIPTQVIVIGWIISFFVIIYT